MNAVYTIFLKQIKETYRNKTILIQFLMFPVLAVIMEYAITIQDMPEHFFAKLFAVMFIGMAPLTCMSAILAEEKEKNTLRVLMMSDVKPVQYLLGTGSYVLTMCMAGAVVFAIIGEYRGSEMVRFLGIMAMGIVLSILAGGIIGVISQTQMAATSVTVPVMMILSFLPMLSMFNETIEKVARITYSQQISILLSNNYETVTESVIVISANFVLATVLFLVAYRRKGLAD